MGYLLTSLTKTGPKSPLSSHLQGRERPSATRYARCSGRTVLAREKVEPGNVKPDGTLGPPIYPFSALSHVLTGIVPQSSIGFVVGDDSS